MEADMSEAVIRSTCADFICRLVISQPGRRNAISYEMWRSLPSLVQAAEANDSVRVIVVEGDGPQAFSSGADISQFANQRAAGDSARAYEDAVACAMAALAGVSKPTVALIRGLAFGGGLGLAMCCDLRLGPANARFRIPAARLGIGYSFAGVELLVSRIGVSAAADILLSARVIDGREAERIGVLTKAWDAHAFEVAAKSYIDDLARNAPLTLRALKLALNECRKAPHERDKARMGALVDACMHSADYLEGQAAFRERRAPSFRGS
jgi:enoyl-CoA hydratase/carnithine racemase